MSRKRLIRLVIAAFVFAFAGRILAALLGTAGPWVLVPLVVVAFWWLSRQGSDEPGGQRDDPGQVIHSPGHTGPSAVRQAGHGSQAEERADDDDPAGPEQGPQALI